MKIASRRDDEDELMEVSKWTDVVLHKIMKLFCDIHYNQLYFFLCTFYFLSVLTFMLCIVSWTCCDGKVRQQWFYVGEFLLIGDRIVDNLEDRLFLLIWKTDYQNRKFSFCSLILKWPLAAT